METITVWRLYESLGPNKDRYIKTYSIVEDAIVARKDLADDYPNRIFFIEKDTVYIMCEDE